MANNSNDRDSLVALDALLHIRDSIRDAGPDGRNGVRGSPLIPQSAFPHVPISGLSNRLPMRPGMVLPPPPSGAPTYPRAQVVALQAAAAAAASTMHHAGHYPSAAPAARAHPVAAMPAPHGTHPITMSQASYERHASQQQQLRQPAPGFHNAQGRKPEERDNMSDRSTSPPNVAVRKEKVEAALKSKPQRGRKRDNLNVMERLELTRTRNREHAKSTRIRKKQRYQELLDSEQQLQDLIKAEELNSQRVQSIKNFLSIREGMLQSHASINNAPSGAQGESQENKVSNGDVQAMQEKTCTTLKSAASGANKNGASVEYCRLLGEIVENMSAFRMEIDKYISTQAGLDTPVLTKMSEWDRMINSRVEESLDAEASRLLVYKVVGGDGGIAVNKDGTGFARVNVVSKAEEGHLILSGILSVKFASGTSRLKSVDWTTLVDRWSVSSRLNEDGAALSPASSSSCDTLSTQVVYPSVVSLEHDKSSESHDSSGPGMSI